MSAHSRFSSRLTKHAAAKSTGVQKGVRLRSWIGGLLAGAAMLSSASAATWNLTGNLIIHDPSIIKEGNTWWAFATGMGVGVKYSPDGLAWTQGVQLFPSELSWWRQYAPAMGNNDVWAADIQKFGDRYYCYYSVSEFGKNNSAIGLKSCTSIAAGDWRDDGFIIGSKSGTDAFNAIDPNLVIDASGAPWLAFGSWFSGIQLVKLDPATMKPTGGITNIAKRNNGIEGPTIVYSNGYYYLFVSIDRCCLGVNSTYQIAYGRSTSITGPYVDKNGTQLLSGGGTILESTSGRWIGPGGQDVYQNGNSWVLARHAYDQNNNGAPTLRLSDLYFDNDGWPTFTEPTAPPAPVITSHPVSTTVVPGSNVSFTVQATGTNLQYQWKKNGTNIAGATAATLTLNGVGGGDAADYTVDVTSGTAKTTSRFARLNVGTPEQGRIINLSVRATAGNGGNPLIVGFVVQGGDRQVLVRGIGPGLAPFGVPGFLVDPKMDLFDKQTLSMTNDNWGANGAAAAMSAVFSKVGAFALTDTASKDSAFVVTAQNDRTVHINSTTAGQSGIALVEVYDAEEGNAIRLKNVSARNRVGTGSDILVAGFVINGNVPKRVVIRGIGPRLTGFQVPNVLADPLLEVHTRINGTDTIVALNNNWGDEDFNGALQTAFAQVGAFGLDNGSKDAAVALTLPPGEYTALVKGVNDTTGEALVEVYEWE